MHVKTPLHAHCMHACHHVHNLSSPGVTKKKELVIVKKRGKPSLYLMNRCNSWKHMQHWLYVLIMSCMHFRVNPHSIVAWMSRNSLLKTGVKSEVLSDCNRTQTHNHLLHKWTLDHLAKLAFINDWAVLWVFISMVHLTVCSYHVMNAFQLESALYSCLNVKELLAWNRYEIWSFEWLQWDSNPQPFSS